VPATESPAVVRVAAVADLHVRAGVAGRFRQTLGDLARVADLLLLAGDLTNAGLLTEGALLCEQLCGLPVPVVAVLGNHDHDDGYGAQIADMLRDVGVRVLDGDAVVLNVAGVRVGIGGVQGSGGGFPHEAGGPPGADETGSLSERLRRGPAEAQRLREAMAGLRCDLRIALTHFSPVVETLRGEPVDIYPALGSHALAEAIDDVRANLAVHGHAHLGTEHGTTPGGVPVRNVAQPVLRRPYAIYPTSAQPRR